MLEKTNLDSYIIIKLIKEKYGIQGHNVTHINRGSANIFNIDNKYILKEFTSDRQVETIEKEYKVIKHLSDNNFNVPDYIETLDNKCYTIYNGRIIIIQKYIDGYTLENNTGDEEKTINSAQLLGKLTRTLESYNTTKNEYKFPSKENLEKGIDTMLNLINDIKEDNPFKEEIKKELIDKIEISKQLMNIDFDDLKNVTIKLCHGDYSVQQLIYTKNDTAIIDFETIKYMPIIWEIIRSYTYIDENCKNGEINIELYKKYVSEVNKYIKLTENDIKYMPVLYLLQLVSSSYGYKQYIKDHTKTSLLDFAKFRTKLCKYLYKNIEKLSNITI